VFLLKSESISKKRGFAHKFGAQSNVRLYGGLVTAESVETGTLSAVIHRRYI
jgi:hypothetical protein